MYEGIRSPAIHVPKTMSDLVSAATRFRNAIYWAGGTYIMSRHDYYPTKDSYDIISLREIPDFKRINRTDRYLEVGPMVTLNQLASIGKQIVPDPLTQTLHELGTRIVRKQATIGGALCTPDIRLAISGTLAVLNTEIELKKLDAPHTESRWVPTGKLYDRNGRLLIAKNEVITRVRMGFDHEDFSYFFCSGNPMVIPDETVSLTLVCSYNQSVITNFRFCVTLPYGGFHQFQDIEVLARGTMLPFSAQQILRIAKVLIEAIESTNTTISALQKERVRRIFEMALHQLNTQSLAER
ncbi:MAG: FAD binding domain-containing protein [Sphaerochaetaceae bacterium]|nr:FAD binding domain-containing protein [Sphaerochaetaceae bacterium]MDD2404822.1 FAD binding domain-containing protein [Sphaerochaetaceae bacterium]MDD4258490.1 FAD binding domain-containing protein [Sphaerochaetaceae bacterium]MDD4840394.1 FAD binding domain-containing protein [Sphaerochaetaceae bacterium]MDX9933511.1 FAD binding domain-containing protein [Sphaerochaetaceae bacterium]